jgi:hypothetical protein
MMAPRRKLDCQAAWALSTGPQWWRPEGWSRFLTFYESEVGGDRLHEADVEDDAVFVGLFTWRSMVKRDYEAAEAELTRFFEHPDLKFVELGHGWEFRCRLAFCALARGREAEAFSAFRSVFASLDQGERRLAACFIRNQFSPGDIQGIGPDLWRKGLASEALTGFIEELVGHIRGRAPRRKRFPPRTSFGRLRRHLWKTYPPSRYDYVRPEPDVMDSARLGCEQALREILAENPDLLDTDP